MNRKPPRRNTLSTTVPKLKPQQHPLPRRPVIEPPAARAATPMPATRAAIASPSTRRIVGRLLDEGDASLLDLVDNLLNKGVVLNAEIVLALADVDLVYLRLSALLCAADRVLPRPTGK